MYVKIVVLMLAIVLISELPVSLLCTRKQISNNNDFHIHSLIDSNCINVPEWQFVYLNDSYNFVCDSDVYNLSIDHWTDVENDSIHPGFLNNAQLSEERQYTCTGYFK